MRVISSRIRHQTATAAVKMQQEKGQIRQRLRRSQLLHSALSALDQRLSPEQPQSHDANRAGSIFRSTRNRLAIARNGNSPDAEEHRSSSRTGRP